MGEHPTGEILERFLRGELNPSERRRVVDHLLGGCPECTRDMAPLAALLLDPDLDPPEGGVAVESYDDAIDRAFAAVRFHGARAPRVKRDKTKALEKLRRHGIPPAGGGAGKLEAVLERARELRRSDPDRMILLLGLAMRAGSGLLKEGYSPEQVADFQARAASEYANALRITHQMVEAEAWLAQAFVYATEGSGDPWLHARLLDLLGSLHVSLYRAKAKFQVTQDSIHAGLACLDLAALLLAQGRTAEGRAEAEEALVIYKTLKIEPEARKALSLLGEALRSDVANTAFLQGLVTFLRRLEHQPWLRFTPSFS